MKTKKIAIVGNGIVGLTCSYLLSKKGYQITVFDENANPGGLANSTKINSFPVEKYYHHFFSTDRDLLDLADNLGLSSQIQFYPSTVGFYINKKFYPFSTPVDLLKFKPLSFLDRIKMGLITIYFTSKNDWTDLENLTCQQLFQKIHSSNVYKLLWFPLLKLKFGKHANKIPATFLWGRIKPRAGSRKNFKEQLGYFRNGFETLFQALVATLTESKVNFCTQRVIRIKDQLSKVLVCTDQRTIKFDTVIFTGNNQSFISVNQSLTKKQKLQLLKIKYQAINCMIISLRNSLSPYYWTNIIDDSISFIGMIEHTQLVPKSNYGTHIMYLFNYLSEKDPLFLAKPTEVFNTYTRGLAKIFSKFDPKDIISWQLSRNRWATPIYDGQYSKKMPPNKFSPHVFLANTSHVYPEDRNVNNGIKLARKIVSQIN